MSCHNLFPTVLRKRLEREKAPECKSSIFQILHPSVSVSWICCYSLVPEDLSWKSRILASDNSIAQLRRDWDKQEGRPGPIHYHTMDGHGIQEVEALSDADPVVVSKRSDSPAMTCACPLDRLVVILFSTIIKAKGAGKARTYTSGSATRVVSPQITRGLKPMVTVVSFPGKTSCASKPRRSSVFTTNRSMDLS